MGLPSDIIAGYTTPHQRAALDAVDAALAADDRLFILNYGGVRAGKSTGAAMACLVHASQRQGQTYLIAAATQRQGMAIFMPTFEKYAVELGLPYKATRGSSPRMEIDGNTFLIYGGSDAGRDKMIQGLTLTGLILDEFPLLHPDFIAQAEARLSVSGALRVYTANKMSPYHWSTLHYYNRAVAGEINAVLLDSVIADNEAVGSDFAEERELEYGEKHFRRFINNEFTLDAEPIYVPGYQEPDADVAADLTVFYSTGHDMVLLTLARYPDGRAAIVSHETLDANTPLADVSERLGRTVLVNSERPTVARQLRRLGHRVIGYDGDYEPRRVGYTLDLLTQGQLTFAGELTDLRQAVDEYTVPGMYKCTGAVRALEMAGEYLARRGRKHHAIG